MYHLVYTSAAIIPLKKYDLLNLLNTCRNRNLENGITGMLIYIEGNFIEAIEGEESTVKRLFNLIENDYRHHNVITLFEEEFENQDNSRSFPDWSMSFPNFHELQIYNIQGLSTYVQHIVSPKYYCKPICACWELLRIFCECNHLSQYKV
jgi:Sensors of blue-light using FAD